MVKGHYNVRNRNVIIVSSVTYRSFEIVPSRLTLLMMFKTVAGIITFSKDLPSNGVVFERLFFNSIIKLIIIKLIEYAKVSIEYVK